MNKIPIRKELLLYFLYGLSTYNNNNARLDVS